MGPLGLSIFNRKRKQGLPAFCPMADYLKARIRDCNETIESQQDPQRAQAERARAEFAVRLLAHEDKCTICKSQD